MPTPPPGFELDPKETLPAGFEFDPGTPTADDGSDIEPVKPENQQPDAEETFRQKISDYGKELAHQLGLTARWGAEGAAGAIGALSDPAGQVAANVLGMQYEPLNELVSRKLSDLGVPEPKNEAEKIVGEITKSIAGAGTGVGVAGKIASGVGGLTGQAAKSLASQPAQQLTGAAGAAAGQQAAEKAGAGEVGQIAASLAGGVAGAGAAGKIGQYRKAQLPESVIEAEKRGIKVMTTDVRPPKTRLTETLQRVEKPQRLAQQEQRVGAVKDFARQYGAEEVQPFIDDVYKELKNKWEFKLGRYYKLKRGVIEKLNDKGVVPVKNTVKKIDEEIAALKAASPSGENDALINQLDNFKTDIQNQGLVNIEEARKRLGDRLAKDPSLAHIKDSGEKVAGRLYKKLNDDMGEFISKSGEPKDYNKWKAGNRKIALMNEDMRFNALRSVLKTGEQTPENVRKLLFSTKPSEIRILYKNLNPAGKRNARMSIIQEAVAKSGGIEELSPDRFKNQIKRLQKQTGVFFQKEDKRAVEGIYRALKYTEGAGKVIAGPPTGQLNVPLLMTTVLGGVGAGGGSVVGGTVGGVVGAVGLPLSLNGASKIYNSRPVRNILLKLPSLKRGSPEEAKLVKRLWTTMQDQYDKQNKEPTQ
ncbi:MAG: hypothetical protein PVJ60_00015 [Phycisphaerales bacterium]|jgi:hypothetical protein